MEFEEKDYDGFLDAWKLTAEQTLSNIRMMGWYLFAGEKIYTLANQAKALSQKYDVVITNPPYMGGNGMSQQMASFVKKKFPDSKADLYAVFIERCGAMIK